MKKFSNIGLFKSKGRIFKESNSLVTFIDRPLNSAIKFKSESSNSPGSGILESKYLLIRTITKDSKEEDIIKLQEALEMDEKDIDGKWGAKTEKYLLIHAFISEIFQDS